jgi:hypothetical protein
MARRPARDRRRRDSRRPIPAAAVAADADAALPPACAAFACVVGAALEGAFAAPGRRWQPGGHPQRRTGLSTAETTLPAAKTACPPPAPRVAPARRPPPRPKSAGGVCFSAAKTSVVGRKRVPLLGRAGRSTGA